MDSPRHNHSLSDGSSSSEVPRSAALPPSQPQNYQAYIESGGSDDESGFGLAPGRVSTDQQAATEERSPRLSEEVWVSDSASARSVTEPRRQERRIDVRDMLSPSPSFPSLDSLRDRSPRRTRFSPHNHGRSRPRQHTRDDELYGPRSPSYGMNRDSQAFGHPDFDRPFFGTNNLPGYYPSAHPSYPFSPYRSEYAQPDYHGDFRRPSHAYESWDDYYGIHAARPHVYPSYHDNSRYQRMPAYHSQGQQPYHSQSSIGYTHRASAFEPIRNPSVILPPPEEVERPLSRRTQSSGQGPTDRDDDTIAGPLTNDWLHDSVYNPQPSWDAGAMPNSSRIVRKVKTSNAAPPSSSINENHEGQTSRAWLQAKTDFPDSNGSSELILSQNLECLEDGSRQTKVILTRTTVPEANTEPAQNPSPHMTWLHICRQTLSVDFLRRLISYCPTTIMGNSIKRVALMLLLECRDRLQHQFEGRKIFEAGANVRYTGILADDHTKETDPVIFLAIPYLSLQGRQLNSARTNDLQPLTLLQTLYGYDIDTERELYSPGSRLNPSTTVGEINVPQLWSMTIGSSILITMSSLSLDEICSGGITIDVQRPIVETCRVRLIPQDRDEIWFIIQRSSTLLNLRNQVAKRLRRKYRGASFDLFTDKLQLLAHDDWTSLMRSPLQNVTLHVRIMDMGMDMIDRTSTSKRLTSSVAPDQQLIPYRQSYNQLQHTRSRSHGQDNTNGTSLTGNKLATLAEIERYSTSGRSKPGPSQDLEIYQRGSPAPMHTMPLRRLESWRMLEWNDDAIQTSEDQLNLSNGHGHLPREKISVQFRLEEGPCEDASSDNTERSIPRISSITESWNASQQQLPDQSSNDAGASGLRNERPPGVNSGLTSRNSSHDALKDGNDSHYASESKMRTNPSVRRERNIESQNGEAEAEASSARLRAVWVSDPNGANARSHQSLSSLPGEDTNQRPNPSVSLPQFISATSWLPFFAWRTSQRSATEDDLRVIRQILTNIHQDLTTMHNEKRLSKLYDKTYQCTYYRLRHRHLCWMEPLSRSTSGSISDLSSEPQRSSPANPSANNSDIPTADLSESPLPDDNTQSLAPHPRSMGTKRHDLTQMFSVSDKIVGLWVPDSSDIVHPLMNRYWGSLDRIFRQYYFASEYTDKLKSQQWFISKPHDTEDPLQRGQEKSSLPLTAYEECLPCKNMFTYSSAQAALEHFHTVHAACSFTKQDKAAFDDPCYVWLRTRDEQQTSSHLDAVARMNQTFTSRLDGVYQAARDLHSTVSQMDLSEDSPLLPTKLAQAFREIVMAHVLQAKCLSLMNEEMMTGRKKATKPTPGLSVRFGSNPLVEFTSRIQLINSKTDACFMKAATLIDETYHEIRFYSDQIVNGDNITMDQIGVEYLIAVIIGHLQSEGPDSTSRGIRDRFRKHMNRLQFEANRKPQRRVFLDLHALQEGLQGVLGVHESQSRLLHDYSILIKPDFDQKPDATRDTMWRLEVELMQKLSSRTRQHDREFHALMGRSELLRQQVKQSIEILEEGHGKAIRVFTIVTLFFLPLSFVSSFFGMNVADVRETTNSQALYWSIAIPITLGVVAIAFLYGYQWEGFLDLLRAAAQTVRKRRQSLEGRHRDFILNRLGAKSFVKFVETEKGRASETRRWQSSRSWWPWKQMSANGLSARFGKPQRADTGISLGE